MIVKISKMKKTMSSASKDKHSKKTRSNRCAPTDEPTTTSAKKLTELVVVQILLEHGDHDNDALGDEEERHGHGELESAKKTSQQSSRMEGKSATQDALVDDGERGGKRCTRPVR